MTIKQQQPEGPKNLNHLSEKILWSWKERMKYQVFYSSSRWTKIKEASRLQTAEITSE